MRIGDLAPGDPSVVGDYRLIGRLGAGGMGIVYLAIGRDGRAVAVKVLRPELTGDAMGRRRFVREVAALRRVRGPHLAEVVDADAEAATPYVVTRYVPGRRLSHVVAANGPLAPEDLVRLGTGLAEALAAVHAGGVVHRDLTPSNVLLVDGEPVVIDFGIAQAVDLGVLTASGLVVGTVGYLAPEQVTRGDASSASDVFAWGATMAYAATGRPPFGGGRPEAVLYRIAHEHPDLVGLPDEVGAAVRAALAREPASRPTAAGLLAALGAPRTVPLVAPQTGHWSSGRGAAPGAEPVTALVPIRDEPRTAVLPPPPTAVLLPPPAPAADSAPRQPRRLSPAVLGLLLLALVAAAAAVAPVVVAAMVVGLLPLLATAASAREAVARRRARRGPGLADPFLVTLALPLHLVRALLACALAVAGAVALVALLGAPFLAALGWRVLEEPRVGVTAAAGVALFSLLVLVTPGGRLARTAVGAVLRGGAATARRRLVVALLLSAAALVAAHVASSSPLTWWPLDPPVPLGNLR
jgi:hypothetical protein